MPFTCLRGSVLSCLLGAACVVDASPQGTPPMLPPDRPATRPAAPTTLPTTRPGLPSLPDVTAPEAGRLRERIERRHAAERFRAFEGIRFDLTVRYDDTVLIDAAIVHDPRRDRTRIECVDGTLIVFDGARCWVSPRPAPDPGPGTLPPRFHARAWTWFLTLPYKLGDPGVFLATEPRTTLPGDAAPPRLYDILRVSFERGTGDTPDDWYRLYVDPTESMLRAADYVVTFGRGSAADAPRSQILFEDHRPIDGVPVPHRWRFLAPDEPQRPTGPRQRGDAELRAVRFVRLNEAQFQRPEGAVEAPPPG